MNRGAVLVATLVAIAVVALIVWALPQLVNDYIVRVVIVMCISGVLVASMGLGNGFTGVFSLGHVGFVAVGAYVSGILSLSQAAKHSYLPDLPGWLSGITLSFLPATIVAGLVCVVLALIVGAPLMRLSGYFVSVATLGFLIIVNVVLINAVDFTRGARTFTGVPLETTLAWAAGWLVLTVIVLARVVYAPTGRRYLSVREDVIAARAVGIKVLPARLSAFALGAFFAGVGGSLQVGGHDRVDRAHGGSRGRGLPAAPVRQRRVGLPLPAPVGVPGGFAVADEQETGHGGPRVPAGLDGSVRPPAGRLALRHGRPPALRRCPHRRRHRPGPRAGRDGR